MNITRQFQELSVEIREIETKLISKHNAQAQAILIRQLQLLERENLQHVCFFFSSINF